MSKKCKQKRDIRDFHIALGSILMQEKGLSQIETGTGERQKRRTPSSGLLEPVF